jgi:hypothetical protein
MYTLIAKLPEQRHAALAAAIQEQASPEGLSH